MTLHAFVPDVMLRSRVEGLARAAGHEVRFFATQDALLAAETPSVVVLDLSHPEGMALLERLQGTPVLGFYAHTDDATRVRALELGARRAVPRSLLMKKFAELVSEVAG